MGTDRYLPVATSARHAIRAGIRLGSVVSAADSAARIGWIEQIGIDRRTGVVTHLLLRSGWLRRQDLLLPLSAVDTSGGGRARLVEPAARLGEVSRSATAEIASATTNSAPQPAPHLVFVSRKTRVESTGGAIGTLYKLLIDPLSARLTHLVVRQGVLPLRRLVVPVTEPADVSAAVVHLPITAAQLVQLERYIPDEELAERVLARLRYYPYMRRLLQGGVSYDALNSTLPRGGTVRVLLRDGVVILQGNVESQGQARMAAWFARQVSGVRAVLNLLVDDAELQVMVAAALGRDPRTRSIQPGVRVDLGRVILTGRAADDTALAAAAAVAAGVRGVRAVENQLRVEFFKQLAGSSSTAVARP